MSLRQMGRIVSAIAVLSSFPSAAAPQGDTMETMMWNVVSEARNIDQLEAFLDAFPGGDHAEEARAILLELQSARDEHALEDSIFDTVGQVTFTTPMAFGNEHIIGRSLEQVIESSPAYPPIEGLPEDLWKNQTCKNCHSWTREDLCVQANIYVTMDPSKYREKQHPFGGLLKVNMRNWAQNGCE